MPSPSFNPFQQIFALSFLANRVGNCTGSAVEIQDKLTNSLNDECFNDNVGPGWRIVWGPAVWQHNVDSTKPIGPDNVWYVAKHDSLSTDEEDPTPVYVVCIAGTAGTGKGYDGQVEDLVVGQVVDVTEWIPDSFTGDVIPKPPVASNPVFTGSTPYVSRGTAIGTHVIASNSPAVPKGENSTYPTVSAFLNNEKVAPGTRLIFAGHSLGAALSPTLAFVLHRAKLLNNFSKVLVYPTAGASPGDANFVAAFKERFPPIPPAERQPIYMTWNQNITNHLDLVPHAWCTLRTSPQNLYSLPTLYGNTSNNGKEAYNALVRMELGLISLATLAWPTIIKKNVYVPLPSSVFSSGPHPVPQTEEEMMALANTCHIRVYIDLICGQDFKFTPGPCATTAGDQHTPMALGHIQGCAESVPTDPEAIEKLKKQLAAE